MLNTKTLCGGGLFPSPFVGFYGKWAIFLQAQNVLFVTFADANVACIYEMTPCFQKTNILNMFTEIVCCTYI